MRTYSAGIVTAYGSAKAGGYTGTYAEFCEALGQLADVLEDFESFSVVVNTLPEGSSATASYSDGVLTLGIPKGDKGDKGDRGATGNGIVSIVKTGTIGLVDTYTITYTDGNTETFTVTNGAKGDTGEKGDTGNGIASITKTATVGKVDTYTIIYTDGTTTTFDVTNGEVSEADLESSLIDKADVILNTASGAIASFSDGSAMPIESLVVGIDAVQSGDPSPTNVRPISGWDEVEVMRTGKNLAKLNNPELKVNTTQRVANINLVGQYTFILTFDLVNATFQSANAALFNFVANGNSNYRIPGQIRRLSDNVYLNALTQPVTGRFYIVWTVTNPEYLNVYFMSASYGLWSGAMQNVQLELGSTASSFEPYNGTTYPINLPQTVYGGKLDVVSGELTVTWGINTYDGSEDWHVSGDHKYYYLQTTDAFLPIKWATNCKAISNEFAYVGTGTNGVFMDNYNNAFGFYVNTSAATNIRWIFITYDDLNKDLDAFKSFLASNPLTVVYEINTPTTITLTPTEVQTILGYNNIFADSGEVEVTYRADTKKYIDGTIVDVPLAMIAPIENGTKSSKAYAVGEYFILNGNQFCKAKTAIASGATFTLNTNYTITTIGAELKALA